MPTYIPTPSIAKCKLNFMQNSLYSREYIILSLCQSVWDNTPSFPIHKKIVPFLHNRSQCTSKLQLHTIQRTEIRVAVHYSTVQCNTVKYNTVQYITIPSIIIIVIMSLKKNYTLTWDCSHNINPLQLIFNSKLLYLKLTVLCFDLKW